MGSTIFKRFNTGGGGGTSDYSDLQNKPQINSTELSGNKSASDLGLASAAQLTTLESNVGDLDDLETEAHDNLVEAINEAYNHGGETVNVIDNLNSDSSTDALSAKQGKALNTALAALHTEIEGVIGAQTNFVGIVTSTSDLPTVTSPSWGLVGTDIDALNAYVWNGTAWVQFGTKTYDFTDYSDAPRIANSGNDADLDISDEAGKVLARFENGHFKTKHFDSATDGQTSVADSDNTADLAISDEEGNAIVHFEDGHIRTKNFDSKELGNTAYDYLGIENALAAKKCLKNTPSSLSDYDQYATIVHITDLHGDAERAERAFKVARAIRANVVCTGDMVRYNSTDDITYLHNIIVTYLLQYDQCLGNHDTIQITDAVAYNKFIQPLVELEGWELPDITNPLYYYRDDSKYKIRYISVAQFQYTSGSRWDYISQEQINFIISSLLSIPADYGVIIMMHSPEKLPVKDDNYSKFFQGKLPYTTTVNNKPLWEIIDAFIGKTTINKTIGGKTVSADFSDVASNEFIAYICGHLHADAISYVPNTINMQLLLNETCTNAWINRNSDGTPGTNYPYNTEVSDLARQEGTPNQDAFNVYVVDRENRQVRIVRIGSNLPYTMNDKRDYVVINY